MNFYLVCFKIRQILLCKIQNEPTLLPALSHLCWKDELGFHNPVLRHSDQGLKVRIVSYFLFFTQSRVIKAKAHPTFQDSTTPCPITYSDLAEHKPAKRMINLLAKVADKSCL